MIIAPLSVDHIHEAALLFIENFRRLRHKIPILPGTLEIPEVICDKLGKLANASPAIAAFEGERLVGYLGWWVVDNLRNANRKGAYVPEWGHAARGEGQNEKQAIYQALYRAAASTWLRMGVVSHAITLLASDEEAVHTWFWNGFGLTVVDAIRPIHALGAACPAGVEIRPARWDEAGEVAALEAEHWRHYPEPPVLMTPSAPRNEKDFTEFISVLPNTVMLAKVDGIPAAYMTFEEASEGACSVVESATTIAITGAFTRPEFRGRKIAPAVLEAGLALYRDQGFERCSVDFESFNPEAAAFWMKYFQPVCLSVIRVPEKTSLSCHEQ